MRTPVAKTIITCAVGGARHAANPVSSMPVTSSQMADEAWEAACLGASVVHFQLRDPYAAPHLKEADLYRDVVERVRRHSPELIISLSVGPSVRLLTQVHGEWTSSQAAKMNGRKLRFKDIEGIRPDICALGLGARVSADTPCGRSAVSVRRLAKALRDAGIKPELEVTSTEDVSVLNGLLGDGTLMGPLMCTVVVGLRCGFQPSAEAVLHARNLLPVNANFAVIGLGRPLFESVALSYLSGGHACVGPDDAVHARRKFLMPSSGAVVQKARQIVEDLGGEVATSFEARAILGLSPVGHAHASTCSVQAHVGTVA